MIGPNSQHTTTNQSWVCVRSTNKNLISRQCTFNGGITSILTQSWMRENNNCSYSSLLTKMVIELKFVLLSLTPMFGNLALVYWQPNFISRLSCPLSTSMIRIETMSIFSCDNSSTTNIWSIGDTQKQKVPFNFLLVGKRFFWDNFNCHRIILYPGWGTEIFGSFIIEEWCCSNFWINKLPIYISGVASFFMEGCGILDPVLVWLKIDTVSET